MPIANKLGAHCIHPFYQHLHHAWQEASFLNSYYLYQQLKQDDIIHQTRISFLIRQIYQMILNLKLLA
jgi:hypothetical protein